MSSQISY